MCAFLLIALFSLSSANNPVDFFDGFIQGLEIDYSNVGICGKTLSTLIGDIDNAVTDIISYLDHEPGAFSKLIADSSTINSLVQILNQNCNISNLIRSISKILDEDGRSIITENYFNSVSTITDDITFVEVCKEDYLACGQSAGEIIRLLTGITLNSYLRIAPIPISDKEILMFFEGFFMTFITENSNTDLCKCDILKSIPSFLTFIDNFQSSELETENAIHLSNEYTAILTCLATGWETSYKLDGIIDIIKEFLDIKTFKLSYFRNTKHFDNLFEQIQNCSKDPFACGASIPILAKLIRP